MIVGTGIDIIELERIERLLGKKESKLISRILTLPERARLTELSKRRRVEYVAGRFAAKEAISKALCTGIGQAFSFQDVAILSQENGAPMVEWHSLTGQASRDIHIHLSISHSQKYAIAQAIIEEKK